jgi:hypothetical protein
MRIITHPAAGKFILAEKLHAVLGLPPIGHTYHKPPRPADANDKFGLDPDHYDKVRASGLTRGTVLAAKLYSEHDTGRLRIMLGGNPAEAPALIFPYFNRFGRRTNYIVARPSKPRTGKKGKAVKYEVPFGQGSRAYFPPFPIVLEALSTPGKTLLIAYATRSAQSSWHDSLSDQLLAPPTP